MPKGDHNRKKHLLAEEARRMIEDEKMVQTEVAKILGIGRTTILRWVKEFQWKTQSVGSRPGDKHQFWKGGVIWRKGYKHIYSPDHPNKVGRGYMAEHRLVMEAKLGRYLERSEVVHHRDGDPTNNHPDNLEVFRTNAEHLKHELTGRCPQWTEDGKRRIREANLFHSKIRPRGVNGAFLPRQTTDHPPSESDSSDAAQACGTEPKPEQ